VSAAVVFAHAAYRPINRRQCLLSRPESRQLQSSGLSRACGLRTVRRPARPGARPPDGAPARLMPDAQPRPLRNAPSRCRGFVGLDALVFTTHVRWHHEKYSTTGRVWQGRFKAFPVQEDHHLLTVMRYVERNALRARLVERAEDWEWSSLAWRRSSRPPVELTESPVPLPSYWRQYTNDPQTEVELAEIRACVNRQRPFGAKDWIERQVKDLGLESSVNPVGRPRKSRRGPFC